MTMASGGQARRGARGVPRRFDPGQWRCARRCLHSHRRGSARPDHEGRTGPQAASALRSVAQRPERLNRIFSENTAVEATELKASEASDGRPNGQPQRRGPLPGRSEHAGNHRARQGRRARLGALGVYEYLGSEDISKDRYIEPAFAKGEFDRLWTRTWQFACREEHIPAVGDYHVYDVGPYSFIVTRGRRERHPRAFQRLPAPRHQAARFGHRGLRERVQVPVPRLELEPRRHATRTSSASGTSRMSIARRCPCPRPRSSCSAASSGSTWIPMRRPRRLSRARVHGAHRRLEARGPLHLPARRRRATLQLEADDGGLHGGLSRGRHAPAGRAGQRRRQFAVRRL